MTKVQKGEKGEKKSHSFKVGHEAYPAFRTGIVHAVCSTYFLAKEIEWASRLFILDMIAEDEEGIGTMISIEHISPALKDQLVKIETRVDTFKKNELICLFEARVGKRLIATGRTGQKILKKEKLNRLLSSLDS